MEPHDIATLIYTSGTTGPPKGVETTHANLLFEGRALASVLPIGHGERVISFLPSAHIADRLTGLYMQLMYGTQITVVPDPAQIIDALPDCRPTIWGAVPRVWEKLKGALELAIRHEPDEGKRHALQWAFDVARRPIDLLRDGAPLPDEISAEHARAESTVLAPLRAKLGFDHTRWTLSGAAPIASDTLAFFAALGLNISEIWGMSELTCIASVAPADPTKIGTVGKLVPGMEMMTVAQDGELFVRGPLVMRGYRGAPDKTAEAIDADGWLHTGDVATVDPDGYLTVVDRKKELIINASGKNMSPANIESTIKTASSLIGAVAAIGDGRRYNTALVTLDPQVAPTFATQASSSDSPCALASDPGIIDAVATAIASANARLANIERIRRFTILPAYWEPGDDELTLTMKLRRKPIAEKYATEIDTLYVDPIRDGVHEPQDQEAP